MKESLADIAKRQASKGYANFKDTDTHTKLKSKRFTKQAGIAGAAIGIANAILDDSKDDPISTGVQSTFMAGMSAGGAELLYQALNDQKLDQRITAWSVQKNKDKQASQDIATNEEKKTIKTSHVSEQETKAKAQNVMTKEAELRKAKNFFSKAKVAGVIGLAAFGAASILDFSEGLQQKSRVEMMKGQQEENLRKKQHEEKKAMKQYGYGHVDMGQMAIDMFNERIGHFKMGNSKFQ